MRKLLFGLFLLAFAANFLPMCAQSDERLTAGQEATFVLNKTDEKVFALDLKKDEFAEIYWSEKNNNDLEVSLKSPSGRELMKDANFVDSFPFVAGENGVYRVSFKPNSAAENVRQWSAAVGYKNVFKLPKSAKLQRQRKVNGYDIRIYNSSDESGGDYGSYLLIEKAGKLKSLMKGGSLVAGGYNFADDAALWDYAAGKKSAALFRAAADKSGEGTPDVAVQYYTGGAHCCFKMYIYELGADGVTSVPAISGDDSDIIAVGKQPKGSLIIKTGDSNFAYWLTSFAGSPIPTVLLTYQNGEFRADSQLMKKPAPALARLRAKAAKARKNISLKAYTGTENEDFSDAFWGEMIDLMYSGNEESAWRFFDLVWDLRKAGKEKFKQDFIEQLNKSRYWQQIQTGKK